MKTLADLVLTGADSRINREEMRRRAGNAMARNLPTFMHCINESNEWVIVGGGPSINDHVDIIRKLKKRGANIVSVNKSHDWLLEHGIVPWGHVLLDPKDWVSGYVKRPRKDVRYFVASQCHDSVFEALDGYPVFLWHAGQDFPEGNEPTNYLTQYWPNTPWFVTPGHTTVSLRVIHLGHNLGADKFHLIGLDSSRSMGKMHAYEKPEAKDASDVMFPVKHRGRTLTFDTNTHMLRQYYDFDKMVQDLPKAWESGLLRKDFDITVYGSGLIPFYAASIGWHADPECNSDPSKVGGFYEDSPLPKIGYSPSQIPITLSQELMSSLANIPMPARLI